MCPFSLHKFLCSFDFCNLDLWIFLFDSKVCGQISILSKWHSKLCHSFWYKPFQKGAIGFITSRRALWKAERPLSRLWCPQCSEGEPSGYTNKNWPGFYHFFYPLRSVLQWTLLKQQFFENHSPYLGLGYAWQLLHYIMWCHGPYWWGQLLVHYVTEYLLTHLCML